MAGPTAFRRGVRDQRCPTGGLEMELGHPSRLLEEIKIVSVEFCAGVKAETQTRRRSGPVT